MKAMEALTGILNAAKENPNLRTALEETDVPDSGALYVTAKVSGPTKKQESGVWAAPGEVTIFYPGNRYETKEAWINVDALMDKDGANQ